MMLVRAMLAVRGKLAEVDEQMADWLAERDRRRRQEAFFLRGLKRRLKTQIAVAAATGLSQPSVSRILDREGHKKHRMQEALRYSRIKDLEYETAEPEETMPTNVVKLQRRRRPDWQPKEPQRREVRKWYQQYLGWDAASQATARQLVFNTEKGRLPDAAYYNDDGHSDGGGAVGTQKRHAAASN